MIRLDKYLADMGWGTRAQVKRSILKGQVTIDGVPERRPETKINDSQKVLYCGENVRYTEYEYYMLNKPAGVISATEDKRDKTVLDLLKGRKRKDLFPVGRLDKDTEGLLLITNDGNLAHNLLSPKKHVDKVYYAKIKGIVTKEEQERFSEGLPIGEGEFAKPARLTILAVDEKEHCSEIKLIIQEGKFHQVKRMFQSVGKEVTYLKRLQMGNLVLDEGLKPGEYRELTEEERIGLC